jgi:murein DD-endopeptidase MepM/ murein hydrolase activator NlpD
VSARCRAAVGAVGLLVVLAETAVPVGAGTATRAARTVTPRATPSAPAPEARTHEIVRGDTLSALGRRYGVSVQALVRTNGLPGTHARLRPGQRLTIPPSTPATAERTRSRPGGSARRRGPDRAPASLLLAVPELDGDDTPEFLWPAEGPISSPYGRRRGGWHRGIDVKADPGSRVLAAAAGLVVASGVEPRYGRVVKIEHPGGFVTVYAHNAENLVAVGTHVQAGEPIATVGRTGRATAPHLHFEIRHGARVYNPLYLLPLPPRVAQVEEDPALEEGHD